MKTTMTIEAAARIHGSRVQGWLRGGMRIDTSCYVPDMLRLERVPATYSHEDATQDILSTMAEFNCSPRDAVIRLGSRPYGWHDLPIDTTDWLAPDLLCELVAVLRSRHGLSIALAVGESLTNGKLAGRPSLCRAAGCSDYAAKQALADMLTLGAAIVERLRWQRWADEIIEELLEFRAY